MMAATGSPMAEPSIPETCVGGELVPGDNCVECLGSAFHCEYLTAIENRWFCHHPRALEIATRTEAARKKAARSAPWWPPTDMGKRLWRTSGQPSF
jgi:hypothetical protein